MLQTRFLFNYFYSLRIGTDIQDSQGFIPNFSLRRLQYGSDIEWLYMCYLKTICCPLQSDWPPKLSWWYPLSQSAYFASSWSLVATLTLYRITPWKKRGYPIRWRLHWKGGPLYWMTAWKGKYSMGCHGKGDTLLDENMERGWPSELNQSQSRILVTWKISTNQNAGFSHSIPVLF